MGSINRTFDVASSHGIAAGCPFFIALFVCLACPRGSRPNGRDVTEADAAFAAGIALKSLDDLVRLDPVWAGLLALAAGAQMRRRRRPADGP
jgi:hypothetical protein